MQTADKRFNVENPEKITGKGSYTVDVRDIKNDEINCRVLDGPFGDRDNPTGTSGRHRDDDSSLNR